MSAHVSSTGGEEKLPVPQTVTPWALAASRSMEALRMPEVISSRSLGSRANTSAGNGVRSLMITTISSSAIAATRSSIEAMCSWMLLASTAVQPARVRATFW